jgi:hypothetical protein
MKTLSAFRAAGLSVTAIASWSLAVEMQELLGMLMTLPVLAGAAAARDPVLGARLVGMYEALRARDRVRYEMPGRAAFARAHLDAARAEIGPDDWDALIAEGRRLSPHAVIDLFTR